jgi:hypothetical protein
MYTANIGEESDMLELGVSEILCIFENKREGGEDEKKEKKKKTPTPKKKKKKRYTFFRNG